MKDGGKLDEYYTRAKGIKTEIETQQGEIHQVDRLIQTTSEHK